MRARCTCILLALVLLQISSVEPAGKYDPRGAYISLHAKWNSTPLLHETAEFLVRSIDACVYAPHRLSIRLMSTPHCCGPLWTRGMPALQLTAAIAGQTLSPLLHNSSHPSSPRCSRELTCVLASPKCRPLHQTLACVQHLDAAH